MRKRLLIASIATSFVGALSLSSVAVAGSIGGIRSGSVYLRWNCSAVRRACRYQYRHGQVGYHYR